MITRNKLAMLGAAALLTASIGLAQTTKPATTTPAPTKAPAATTHVMNGTIQSVTGSGAAMTVVVQGAKKTDKPVTLVLNASTTKTGDLAQGAKVTAHYSVVSGQNIATSIVVAAAKPAAAVASKTPASSTTPPAKTK